MISVYAYKPCLYGYKVFWKIADVSSFDEAVAIREELFKSAPEEDYLHYVSKVRFENNGDTLNYIDYPNKL